MAKNEIELRTDKFNLLMCMVNHDEKGNFYLELKNRKRKDCISLEQFVDKINQFMKEYNREIHIVCG